MGLPPAILVLACATAATIAAGTTRTTPDPTVGWQPPSALPFGPALLGGNETALLMRSRTSAACGAWLPPGLARMRGNVPFFRYSTFMARCGHAARGATVAPPADGASAAAFANASALVRGPLGAGFLAVVEGGADLPSTLADENERNALAAALARVAGSDGVALAGVEACAPADVVALLAAIAPKKRAVALYETAAPPRGLVLPAGAAIYALETAEGFDWDDLDASVGVGLTLSLERYPVDPSIVETHDNVAKLAAAGVRRALVDADWTVPAELARAPLYGGLLVAYRGVVGMPWQTLSPPAGGRAGAWRAEVAAWRRELRNRFDLARAPAYGDARQAWASARNWVAPQAMLHDRFLYDRASGAWTPDRFLDDARARYGRVDALLLWHAYPNIGVDDRDQFAMLADVPRLGELVAALHDRNVSALLAFNPWDSGTRHASAAAPTARMSAAALAVGADGINGDTLFGMAEADWPAADGLALMPEVGVDARDDALLDAFANASDPYRFDAALGPLRRDVASWNYMSYVAPGDYGAGRDWTAPFAGGREVAGVDAPLASRPKALDGRHDAMVCERWESFRLRAGLQHAFFNGGGYAPWENVWGVWNGLSDRDAEALRRVAHFYRFFADRVAGGEFVHFAGDLDLPPGVFASRAGGDLWLVVDRRGTAAPAELRDPATRLPGGAAPFFGAGFVDAWNGRAIDESLKLDYFGAALRVDAVDDALAAYLRERRAMTARDLDSYSAAPARATKMTRARDPAPSGDFDASNMTFVAGGAYRYVSRGVQVEGHGGLPGPGPDLAPDVAFEFENRPSRKHDANLVLGDFYVDTYPATNRRFLAFVRAAKYAPKDAANFLKHAPGPGDAEQPARWVDRDDAAAFCAHEGKRLPRPWELQRAAVGPGPRRRYPWGDAWDAAAAPPRDSAAPMKPPRDVGAFPRGRSPEGVADLAATIWHMTDAWCDARTCRTVLFGGSTYRPAGSAWYFPQAYRTDEHATLLQLAPGLDRSAAVGFRCVADAP